MDCHIENFVNFKKTNVENVTQKSWLDDDLLQKKTKNVIHVQRNGRIWYDLIAEILFAPRK